MADHHEPQSAPPGKDVEESPAALDKEIDTFEDALDNSSVRSLTARKQSASTISRPSSSGSALTIDPNAVEHVRDVKEPLTHEDPPETAAEEASHTVQVKEVEVDPDSDSDADSEPEPGPELELERKPEPEPKPEPELVTEPMPGAMPEEESGSEAEVDAKSFEAEVDAKSFEAEVDAKSFEAEVDTKSFEAEGDSKSARASSRLSHTDMDIVDLNDDASAPAPAVVAPTAPASAQPLAEEKEDVPPPVPEKQPSKKLSISNIASSLPAMPWSPSAAAESPPKTSPNTSAPLPTVPPPVPEKPPVVSRASTGRNFTSPFSWLSRNSTAKETVTSPPTAPVRSPRRDTASSIATLTSNPDMLSKLEEGDEGVNGRPKRNSLRDRFKMVRMREEAGITLPEDDKAPPVAIGISRSATSLGIMSPGNERPTSPGPTSPNPALAPGTASGASAGPSSATDAQVDWDLWQSVVYEGPSAVAKTSPEELNGAIATGIPTVIRGVVWQVLAESKNEELEQVYRELAARGTDKDVSRDSNGTSLSSASNSLSVDKETVASSASSIHSEVSGANGNKTPPSEKDTEAFLKAQVLAAADRKKKEKEDAAMLLKLEKAIRRDLGARTSYSKHAQAAGLQEGLFGVCKAYALFDEGVGYAQGMNFLIMPLLFNMPEDEAFCLLVRLMNHYKLRDLFIQDMPGLHMHLYQFERLLEDLEPAVYCHLKRRGISPHLYATQWFLTLFAYRFPLQLVLRIYDLIFSEGLSAILKFGIVLMQKNASTLLGLSDMVQLTSFLRDKLFDVYIDQAPSTGSILENGFFGSSSSNIDKEVYRAEQLVRDACEVKITPELLQSYTIEWEEKTRTEKQREEELEHLKQSNTSYTIKVRKLEERLQAADMEQTNMANELVHTKIENEELKDENESLKGQVKELRNVIEKQPEELEEAWKLERDSLLQRNEKVHEENQKIEKEMSELEEQLVQTKMRYAEINDQYESLQRKWGDLRKQFA
ncbi:rab-GTPase-TBC domain-containing protein [Truncatella angustata]|uniref:GTPase-activating protein GYP5 n=1 Tax=Truncatella angustata TaxID=152316 RepID=A0A9P8RIK3_9PEZI|nr:rab-GTPase-TBC domain-containing protein [Truncatella angustata]KAH6646704.1 rab-GTPase-TBC domain-containing protein [Truncatella angustata]